MDQDSGRGSERAATRRGGRTRPEPQLDDQPPTGPVSPLPRRSAQEHMEPQLRRPGSSGTGTPFNPFDPFAADDKAGGIPAEPGGEAVEAAESTRAADFNKGSRRGRRRTDPPAG